MSSTRRVIPCTVVSLLVLALSATAHARKPEDVFGGKVMLSEKPYPLNARSAEAYIDQIKKQSKERFDEDKAQKQWHIYMACFFKAPVNDLEVTIKVFDVTKGTRLVDTFEQYLTDGKQRAYLTELLLKQGDGTNGYDPNTKLHVVVTSRGKTIAESLFYLIGEKVKYTGKVDFSKDDE